MSAVKSSVVNEAVESPAHYTWHPSGVEVYLITQEMWCPNLANTFKYMARYEHKGKGQDLLKAAQYVSFEIERRNTFWFSLPDATSLRYEKRYEPFYLYIAKEPDQLFAARLVQLWNADKSDSHSQIHELQGLHNFLICLAEEIDKRALRAEEADPASAEPQALRREIRDHIHVFRKKMEDGDMADWNSWEIAGTSGWYPIVAHQVFKGGKVKLNFERDGEIKTRTYGPREVCIIRAKEIK